MRRPFAFVGMLLLLSCSSTSIRQNLPPEERRALYRPKLSAREIAGVNQWIEDFRKQDQQVSGRWWSDYSQGLVTMSQEPTKSCQLFQGLAQDPQFPLQQEALLRAAQVCTPSDVLVAAVDTALDSKEPWLQWLAIEAGLRQTQKDLQPKRRARFLFEQSFFIERVADKVRALREALSLAQKAKDTPAILRIQGRLYQIAPRLLPNPPLSRLQAVADDFRKNREFSKARTFYRRVLAEKTSSPSARIDALKGVRQSYRLEEIRESYVQATRDLFRYLSQLYKTSPANWVKDYHDGGLLLARTLWTEGLLDETHRTLESLEKSISKRFPLSEIQWLRSRMMEEKGDFQNVVQNSLEALKTAEPNHPAYELLLWQVAWNARKAGDLKTSLDYFEKLKNITGSSQTRYRYWYGRLLKESQNLSQAETEFETLFRTEPLSFYSIMALRELGRPLPPLKASEPNLEKPGFLDDLQFAKFKWYTSVGENNMAQIFLRHVSRKLNGNLSENERATLLRLFAEAGDFAGLFERVLALDPLARQKLVDTYPDFVFPMPFENLVQTSASRFRVPPELVYSIMRQESSFNTLARSPADAFGLMQIIPRTASEVARSAQLPYENPDDLYSPDINVPIGAAILRRNMDRFKGQFILSVASYNASEGAVRGWVKTRFREDPLEFIEDIPYAETMGYVKLVLRNYVFYLRLRSGGNTVPFPEDCLKGLQDFKN